MSMRVVTYLRVSTDRQAEQGFGLDVQCKQVRGWVKSQGHRIVSTFSDEGQSGTKDVADRPGLRDALKALQDGKADALVVPRLDRLARSLSVQEAALAMVWRSGARVFSVDSGEVMSDDPNDPMRTAMRQMMGVFSQLERSMITARMRAGRQMKADKGGYAYGAPPLGYSAHDGVLVADENEQATVRRIMALRSEGESLRAIADTLTAEGLRPKRSERWHPQTLSSIIERQSVKA
jgi:DNA invertase Pin-like site-specific DNA recombinase